MTKRHDQPGLIFLRGTSLLELLGFLAVAALLIGGSLGLYQLSTKTARVDEVHGALEITAARLKQYAIGRDNADLPADLANVKPPNGWLSGTSFSNSRDGCRISFTPNSSNRVFSLLLEGCEDIAPLIAKKKVAGSTASSSNSGDAAQTVTFSGISW